MRGSFPLNGTYFQVNEVTTGPSLLFRLNNMHISKLLLQGFFNCKICYLQVFSDHESSLSPMDVPREWLWNLPRRTVYFGTSIPTIFKGNRARNSLVTKHNSSFSERLTIHQFFLLLGLSTEGIQYCFWRGMCGYSTVLILAASTSILYIKKQT